MTLGLAVLVAYPLVLFAVTGYRIARIVATARARPYDPSLPLARDVASALGWTRVRGRVHSRRDGSVLVVDATGVLRVIGELVLPDRAAIDEGALVEVEGYVEIDRDPAHVEAVPDRSQRAARTITGLLGALATARIDGA